MKIVDVPPAITLDLRNPQNEKVTRVYSFLEFLKTAIDNYPKFGQGFAGIRQGIKLYGIVDGRANGEPLRLEDADFDALRLAVDTCPYHPAVARQVLSYVEAVEKAQTVDAPGVK